MKIAVVGNSVASLVALDVLRQNNNRQVTWFQEGSLPSGIWRGTEINGQTIDYGMVNFEIDLPNNFEAHSIDEYDLFSLNSCANFTSEIKEYIQRKIDIAELPKIKILTNEGYISDFLISNDLEDLKKYLKPKQIDLDFQRDPGLTHPSRKYERSIDENFGSSFDEYGKQMYPPSFHEKVLRKWGYRLLGELYQELQTIRHRSGWLPLYYPETVMKAIIGKVGMQPYSFHYPKFGSISEMWSNLAKELHADGTVLKKSISDLEAQGRNANFDRIIWGSSLQNFRKSFDPQAENSPNFKRGKIDIEFYRVPNQDFDYCALNLNSGLGNWYRATVSPNYLDSEGKKLLCVEFKNVEMSSGESHKLDSSGLNLENGVKVFDASGIPVFSLPSNSEIDGIQSSILNLIKNYKNVHFVGPVLMPFAQTMNDQIIQGMRASIE
jgi:hypothetical protein